MLPGRDFLQFLEFKNGDLCDPDAAPAAHEHATRTSTADSAAEGSCGVREEVQEEVALTVTWDAQWLQITQLFHPLFPSTPCAMLPPHAAALAALSSTPSTCHMTPPPFEMPVAPVVDPASNLQVRCSSPNVAHNVT